MIGWIIGTIQRLATRCDRCRLDPDVSKRLGLCWRCYELDMLDFEEFMVSASLLPQTRAGGELSVCQPDVAGRISFSSEQGNLSTCGLISEEALG